ncbi:MAG: hypothetical protein V4484_16245 [Pseudomonadota bacterium]
MKSRVVAAAALSLSLAGCASISTINISNPGRLAASGSKFPDRATIYMFRGASGAGAVWSFPVTLDETKIGSIRREQYLAFPAITGAHWLVVACPSLCAIPGFKINLEATAGKSYYFMIEPDVAFRGNTVTMSSLVTQIDQTFAERLMATYKAAEFSGP